MTLRWIEVAISIAVSLQGLELLVLRSKTKLMDPWQWPGEGHSYTFLCALTGIAGLVSVFWPTPWTFLIMWIGTWLIAVRWRGTFNGASDFMTFQILGAVLFARLFPQWQPYSETYIALQLTLSYFVSGVSKVRTPAWRSGLALQHFLTRSNAVHPRRIFQKISTAPGLLIFASWAVIAFECLFPLIWFEPSVRLVFLGLGVAFHIANFYAFGLNRFVFAWLAGYPALYAL